MREFFAPVHNKTIGITTRRDSPFLKCEIRGCTLNPYLPLWSRSWFPVGGEVTSKFDEDGRIAHFMIKRVFLAETAEINLYPDGHLNGSAIPRNFFQSMNGKSSLMAAREGSSPFPEKFHSLPRIPEVISKSPVLSSNMETIPETLDVFFDPFYRADKARDFVKKNIGMGLSFYKEVMIILSGEITATKSSDHSLCFTIRLPSKEHVSD